MSKKDAKKLEHDKDYKVPDFGLDEDVVIALKNIADQEKLKKVKWVPKQDENGVWIVPEANDNDSYSYKSLLQTDSNVNVKHHHRHHHTQEETSDPICSSAGHPCDQNKRKSPHPIDYKVPNFGVDEDIVSTQSHIAEQEKKQGHKWTPKKDENGNYNMPAANGARTGLAQVSNDPICHSAGCPKTKWFGQDKDHQVVYYDDLVAKNGYDEDIIDSVGNEMMVSKAMGFPFKIPMYAQIDSEV
jgi:hypothetical protein